MENNKYTLQIILLTLVFLIGDFIWIYLFMGDKYKKMVPEIQNEELKINLYYGIFAYIFIIAGLIIFVLPKISKENKLRDSFLYGFTYGVILYGVYDLTAGAIFKKWDLKLAIYDILWGGFISFISIYLASLIE